MEDNYFTIVESGVYSLLATRVHEKGPKIAP